MLVERLLVQLGALQFPRRAQALLNFFRQLKDARQELRALPRALRDEHACERERAGVVGSGVKVLQLEPGIAFAHRLLIRGEVEAGRGWCGGLGRGDDGFRGDETAQKGDEVLVLRAVVERLKPRRIGEPFFELRDFRSAAE